MAETQGDRVRLVRDALRMQQAEFADAMNARAALLGVASRYDNTAVSKLENGRRDLSVDDLFVISSLDPKSRGERWLALGVSDARSGVADVLPPAARERVQDPQARKPTPKKRSGGGPAA